MSIKGLSMAAPRHLCVLYVATGGLQGPLMGSDEQEIVLLIYVIINVSENKLQTETPHPDHMKHIADRRLDEALADFEGYCASLELDPRSPDFRIVTDGQLPIRQCLHPEAWRKEFELPDYYNVFHDLRKEVATFLGRDEPPGSIADILDRILLNGH
ncbi:hypothetical protein HUJ04_013400 [Dendroctonus ponderosae]|nr:hypothetical protein HUJ04_013400 [Dendroctonus ponderosae]